MPLSDSYYHEYVSDTYNDTGLAWNKAFVIAERDSSTHKIIGTPTTSSRYYGFHPGTSWEHDSGRSWATVNSARTGGTARTVGVLSLYIIIKGVGEITSRDMILNWTYGK